MRPIILIVMLFSLVASHCPGGSSEAPTIPLNLSNIKSVVLQTFAACALDNQGKAGCWEHPKGTDLPDYPKKFLSDLAVEKYTAVVIGDRSANSHVVCAVRVDGKVRCAIVSNLPKITPDKLAGLGAFTQVSTGDDAFCGLKVGGELACYEMQLNTSHPSYSAANFENFSDGINYGCGVTKKKALECVKLTVTPDAEKNMLGKIAKKLVTDSRSGNYIVILEDDRMVRLKISDYKTMPVFEGDVLQEHFDSFSYGGITFCGIVEGSKLLRCFQNPVPASKTNEELGHERFSEINAGLAYVQCGLRTDKTMLFWWGKSPGRVFGYPTGVPDEIRAE